MASRYSADQVCEILTGDSDEVEFLFPGSDDDLDAFELEEDGSDLEEEGGIGLGEDVLGKKKQLMKCKVNIFTTSNKILF